MLKAKRQKMNWKTGLFLHGLFWIVSGIVMLYGMVHETDPFWKAVFGLDLVISIFIGGSCWGALLDSKEGKL